MDTKYSSLTDVCIFVKETEHLLLKDSQTNEIIVQWTAKRINLLIYLEKPQTHLF